MNMRLLFLYCRMNILQSVRKLSNFTFTVIFPIFFMLAFGRFSTTQGDSLELLTIFTDYAVQVNAMLLLGMTVSLERLMPWSLYVRTLPAPPIYYFVGQIASIFPTTLISLIVITNIGIWHLGVSLSLVQVTLLISLALLGGIPMSLLGITLGNLFNAVTARGAFVLVNLGLLFGVISLPNEGPLFIFKQLLPTYHWMKLTTGYLTPNTPVLIHWIWMFAFTIVFFVLAKWTYTRSQNLRET